MGPESRFRQSYVLPFLKALKHTWFTSVQQMTSRGTPDFLLCINGRFVGMELKAPGGIISALQRYNLHEIQLRGGIAIIASPLNWSEVKDVLRQLDQGESHDQNHQLGAFKPDIADGPN